jgi:predicted N-formylglutamate amidohydrolase
LITSEHGGNRVPARYAALFRAHRKLLDSHRGCDFGSLKLARVLAGAMDCALIFSQTTRLLVELNRSLGHPHLFSRVTRTLPAAEREQILRKHYHPHRERVERRLLELLRGASFVLHLSVHSFTPVLNGVRRTAEFGLLYDPARPNERRFCQIWRHQLRRADLGDPRVRRNYPYRGAADGLTTSLRRKLNTPRYLGIEIEVNAGMLRETGIRLAQLHRGLSASLVRACDEFSA